MKKHIKYLILGIKGACFYFWGHIFAFFLYDKKYLKGKWFEGKMNGLCSYGWRWVVEDTIGNFFLRKNSKAPWPISPRIEVALPENIEFHPDCLNNFQGFGNYYQAFGKITIGKGTWIAGNVGIITSNHKIGDLDQHDEPKPVTIGNDCWIGMNSVILPGVILGDYTVVGAGSVVTKSFEKGNCVLAGNPAKVIKYINEDNRRYYETSSIK